MRLTDRQAAVYRELVAEAAEAGEPDPHRDTYNYWIKYVAPDWRAFWAAWSRKTPDPLWQMISTTVSIATGLLVIKHAARVAETMGEAGRALQFLVKP